MSAQGPRAGLVPLAQRQAPAIRYRRMPSALMPEPIIPDRVVMPAADILQAFAVEVALDDATEAEAFAVRWQVYCHELGYEPAERFPDGREYDADDQRSLQVVVRHRASGRAAACFRLLLAGADAPFHLEQVCPRLDPGRLPAGEGRHGLAEVSRFCIRGEFRRFDAANDQPPWGLDPQLWRDQGPHRRGLAGLMWLAAAHLAVTVRLDYLLALMEPRLQALGRLWGFTFEPIGEAVEFRGQRVPYRLDRRSLRALLALPAAAALVAPMAGTLEAGAVSHPLLRQHLAARTDAYRSRP